MRRQALGLVLAAALSWGCSRGASDPGVLARVGEASITATQLRAYEARLAEKQRRRLPHGIEARRARLRTLIDRLLLLQAARAQGLFEDPEVLEQLGRRQTQQLAEEMQKTEVLGWLSVSVAEVEREYGQGGWAEQVVTREIYVPDRGLAAAALEQLRRGTDFGEVARRVSVDRVLRLPTNGPTEYAYSPGDPPQDVAAVVLNLPVGAVSDTIAWREGYVIAQVKERRPVALTEVAEKVSRSLTRQKREALRAAYLIRLRESCRLALHQPGMDLAVDLLGGRTQADSLPPTELEQPVYSYDGGSLSVAQAIDELRRRGVAGRARDEGGVAGYLKEQVLPEYLMALDARRRGLDQSEAWRQWREGELAELVLTRLHRAVLGGGVEVTPADLEEHYEAHKRRFRIPPAATVLDILVVTPEEARALRDRILGGEAMEELARRHSRRGGATEGRLTVYANQEFLFGEHWLAVAMNAPIGQLQGPVGSRGGYSIFRVLERQAESFLPLEGRVEEIVRGEVRELKEQVAFNQYLQGLREQRAGQIEICDGNLEKLGPEPAPEVPAAGGPDTAAADGEPASPPRARRG